MAIPIIIFVLLMAVLPIVLGLVCRRIVGKPSEPTRSSLITIAQLATLLGWGGAFALAKMDVLSYQASVLFGAFSFVPGQFFWAYFTNTASKEE